MTESESVQTPIEEPTIAEQIEEVMESERTRPDFTEVLVPEKAVKQTKGMLGTVVVKDKKVIKPNNLEEIARKQYVQNEEQSDKTRWQNIKGLSTEEQYHQKVESRINDLMTKIENNEIKLSDLPEDDQRVINEINKNKNG